MNIKTTETTKVKLEYKQFTNINIKKNICLLIDIYIITNDIFTGQKEL